MCVFRHARLIMREICTMPVPFFCIRTRTHITYFHLNTLGFFFYIHDFFPRSIQLFNELYTHIKTHTKQQRMKNWREQKKKILTQNNILNFASFICFCSCIFFFIICSVVIYSFHQLFFDRFRSSHLFIVNRPGESTYTLKVNWVWTEIGSNRFGGA